MDNKTNNFSTIIEEQTRSDELLQLREMIDSLSYFNKQTGNAIQLRLVIDTNVVLKDLIFLSKNARQANARTSLMEAVAAGTVVPHAPFWLCTEVEKYLPEICEKKGISFDVIATHWEAYREKIQFFDIGEEQLKAYADSVDPDDAPFVELEKNIDVLGILSDDPHIENMGGTRITLDVLVSMRDYSRHAAIEFKIKYMGVVTGFLSLQLILSIFKGIGGLFKLIGNLPKPIQYTLIGVAVWGALDPNMRDKAMEKLRNIGDGVTPAIENIAQFIMEMSALSKAHSVKAKMHHEKISQGIIKHEIS